MIENIKSVARRLQGLRDALDLTTEQVAADCGLNEQTYKNYESGNFDIPISFVQTLAERYGVQVAEILFGESPRIDSYYVTRAGQGASVERSKAYSYQSLAEGFTGSVMHPFLVTLEPDNNATARPNTHAGQEFNYIIEGREEFHIGQRVVILEPGDSVVFNARYPHYMQALDNKRVVFITVIAQ